MKKTSVILLFLFSACVMDSIYFTELVNETGEDIEINLFLDRPYMDSLKIYSYKAVLEHYADRAQKYLISVDTIATSATYKIPRNQTTDFFDGMGTTPDFRSIRLITVKTSKRIKEYSRDLLTKSIKKEGRKWVWHVR